MNGPAAAPFRPMKPRRIVFKLSGEMLAGAEGFGLYPMALAALAAKLKAAATWPNFQA